MQAPTSTNDTRPRSGLERLGRWAPALLLLGAAGLYLSRLGRVGLYDLDEAVYAEISREMAALGNWVTPHLDSVPYLEKPPLFYWLNALAFKALGLSEFSARLTTALAAVAAVAFAYAIGRDFWGRRAGLAAGAVLATSFGFFIFGRLMLPDMLFVSLVTAAFWGFGRALVGEASARAVYGGYAAMGLAVMAKGILGAVFPALALGAFVLVTRDWALVRRLRLARGGAVFLLITVPWHLLVEREHPGFLWFYAVNEHILRFLGHRSLVNYATLPVPTFLAITLVWFCPWSVFLPAAVGRCWPGARPAGRAERGSLLVLLWAASVIGLFTASASRLEYYGLPALPALALCVGRLWDAEMGAARGRPRAAALTAAWVALVALAACLVPAAAFFPRLEHMEFYNLFPNVALERAPLAGGVPPTARVYLVPDFSSLVPLLETVVALVIAGTAVSAWAWFRGRPGLALAGLAAAMAAGLVVVEGGFRLFEPHRSIARLAAVVREEARAGEPVLLEGAFERHAGLGFYTGRRVRMYRGSEGILKFGSRYADTADTFVSDEAFARLWRGPGRAYLVSEKPDCLDRLRAIEPATIVLGREGATWLFANHPRAD